MTEGKRLIEETFTRFDPAYRLLSFRAGSRAFSPALFRVLERCGLRYDSTLACRGGEQVIYEYTVDDSGTPGRCHYFTAARFKEDAPGPTNLVELPVSSHIPDLEHLLAPLRPGEPLVVSSFVHPFNFHRDGRRCWSFFFFYNFILFCLERIPGARFTHMAEAGRAWEKWCAGYRETAPTPPESKRSDARA